MRFENPVKRRLMPKENKKIEDTQVQKQNNDNMIPISQIAPGIEQKQNVEIEYITYPNFGMLTSAPRMMEASINELGNISIKFDNALDNISKIM